MHRQSLFDGPTLGKRLASNGGIGPGFGALRLGAAFAVVAAHAPWLTEKNYDFTYWISNRQTFLGSIAVAAFFVMSGFLVAQSAARSASFLQFAGKRALRILPALIVVVALTSLVLGPLFTSLSIERYFADRQFWTYHLNVLLLTRHTLPGVFSDHVVPLVNGSLWTLRYEAMCYVILGVSALILSKWTKPIILGMTLAALVLTGLAAGDPREILDMPLHVSFPQLGQVTLGPLVRLFVYFGLGTVAFLYRDMIVLNRFWMGAAVIGLGFGLFLNLHDLLFPICGGYLILALGMSHKLDLPWLRGRDYSYGVYIYSFPVQQALIAITPLAGHWTGNLLLSTPIVLLCAALSWHCVEKPALEAKSLLASFAAGARAP